MIRARTQLTEHLRRTNVPHNESHCKHAHNSQNKRVSYNEPHVRAKKDDQYRHNPNFINKRKFLFGILIDKLHVHVGPYKVQMLNSC